MTVTLSDIAKRVGVSHPVVSKVLHGGQSTVGVSPLLRTRIQEIATELGYRPNAAGRALRNQRYQNIGILVGRTEDYIHLPQHMLAHLSSALSEADFTASLVCASGMEPEKLLQNPLLRARQIDALIVSHVVPVPAEAIELFAKLQLPVVWLHQMAKCDSVGLDETGAVGRLVEHFASLGHERIHFVDYSSGLTDPATQRRLAGFEDSAMRLKIDMSMMVSRHIPRADRYQTTLQWLDRSNHPRAIIANSMHTAQAIQQTALQLGMKIPNDLSIATFDDGSSYDACIPQMTAMIAPYAAMGRAAAAMALQKVRQPGRALPNQVLAFEMAVGESTVANVTKQKISTVRNAKSARHSYSMIR